MEMHQMEMHQIEGKMMEMHQIEGKNGTHI